MVFPSIITDIILSNDLCYNNKWTFIYITCCSWVFPHLYFSAQALLITYASQVNNSFLMLLPVQCKYLLVMICKLTIQHEFEFWWPSPLKSMRCNKGTSPKLNLFKTLLLFFAIFFLIAFLDQNNQKLVLLLFEYLQFFIPNHLQCRPLCTWVSLIFL